MFSAYLVFRFCVVVLSFLWVSVYFKYAPLYTLVGLLYVFAGFVPEIYKGCKSYLVVLIATTILLYMYFIDTSLFFEFRMVDGNNVRQYTRVNEPFYAFSLYNIIILLLGYIFIHRETNSNK